MGEHYTLNTVETSAWCAKCNKRTPHRVQGRKLGPCLVCVADLDQQHEAKKGEAEPARQGGLFND